MPVIKCYLNDNFKYKHEQHLHLILFFMLVHLIETNIYIIYKKNKQKIIWEKKYFIINEILKKKRNSLKTPGQYTVLMMGYKISPRVS